MGPKRHLIWCGPLFLVITRFSSAEYTVTAHKLEQASSDQKQITGDVQKTSTRVYCVLRLGMNKFNVATCICFMLLSSCSHETHHPDTRLLCFSLRRASSNCFSLCRRCQIGLGAKRNVRTRMVRKQMPNQEIETRHHWVSPDYSFLDSKEMTNWHRYNKMQGNLWPNDFGIMSSWPSVPAN